MFYSKEFLGRKTPLGPVWYRSFSFECIPRCVQGKAGQKDKDLSVVYASVHQEECEEIRRLDWQNPKNMLNKGQLGC